MAASLRLSRTDPVSDQLLHDIAKHVVPAQLRYIAYDLGIPEAKVSQIEHDNQRHSVMQMFKVLNTWKEKTVGLTTQQVVAKVYEWQRNACVDPGVWHSIQALVDFQVLNPAPNVTANHATHTAIGRRQNAPAVTASRATHAANPGRKPKQLTDLHLLRLSQRITNDADLMRLGIEVLGLETHTVEAARYDSRHDIRSAAHDVIQSWKRRQGNLHQAYVTLYKSLHEQDMSLLAEDLKQWVEGE